MTPRPTPSLVVFLRGVNVGGHRAFKPTTLAHHLRHLGTVNVGAAGTFVVREPIDPAELRVEVARGLPFETEIVICDGRDLTRLVALEPFAGIPLRADMVRFVSVLARHPRLAPLLPMQLPAAGQWLLKILGRDRRFVFGVYRRQMKAIAHLGTLDRLFGVPVTTRNWNTICRVATIVRDVAKVQNEGS
jgi:uncharacterized protein (DUF1697 family)